MEELEWERQSDVEPPPAIRHPYERDSLSPPLEPREREWEREAGWSDLDSVAQERERERERVVSEEEWERAFEEGDWLDEREPEGKGEWAENART
ncbi:hypothetical protein KIPB_011431 [Kipferlia bialata]|uniref:Uncharacterized protein n=1 Tax=Kipferlia bialata TaxID=797122 RepID=A0A391NZH9_9EUKA|nr:hypothetical protein KIPB_011431 [Kipferlia bialata]|eukprot:g11431.t1